MKIHHTKGSEKQVAWATQHILPQTNDDIHVSNQIFPSESQPFDIPQHSMASTPTRLTGKRKQGSSTCKSASTKSWAKRNAASKKSPFESDINAGENEELTGRSFEQLKNGEVSLSGSGLEQQGNAEVALNGSELEQPKSDTEPITEGGLDDSAVKYTSVVPVSGPIPTNSVTGFIPKIETENLYDDNNTDISKPFGEDVNFDGLIVKEEVEVVSDTEPETNTNEEDSNWEPVKKKRRKTAVSSSVRSPRTLTGSKTVKSPDNIAWDQAQSDVASDLIENVATIGHPSLSPYPVPKQSVIKSCKRPPDYLRFDSMDHFPVWDTKRQRCKFRDCFESFSFIKCFKCNVHLCLNKERNCFISFHMRSNNVTLVTADSDSVLKGKDSFEMQCISHTIIVKKTPLSSAERQRLYRKRRDSDPVKRQLYLQELKARYHKKSKAGKTKLVKNMTAEEHREMKEKWKYFKQKERAKMREQLKVKMFGQQTVTDD